MNKAKNGWLELKIKGEGVKKRGEELLKNWGNWCNQGGSTKLGYGNSVLAGASSGGMQLVDVEYGLLVEAYLLDLRTVDIELVSIAVNVYQSGMEHEDVIALLGMRSGRFYALRNELVMAIGGTTLKNVLATSKLAA